MVPRGPLNKLKLKIKNKKKKKEGKERNGRGREREKRERLYLLSTIYKDRVGFPTDQELKSEYSMRGTCGYLKRGISPTNPRGEISRDQGCRV